MTRRDANALLDETFGGEDGTSPIQFGREPHYRRHPSEKLVMDRRGYRYNRYQATPSADGPSLKEVAAGVVVLLTWFGAIFWALPILAEAVMRP